MGLWCKGSIKDFDSFGLGSNPSRPTIIYSEVIQLVECQTVTLDVAGAEPAFGEFN